MEHTEREKVSPRTSKGPIALRDEVVTLGSWRLVPRGDMLMPPAYFVSRTPIPLAAREARYIYFRPI